ncbi:2OG-Fe(II) oxygenase [Flavobacteriaceae bacterium]|nr:2OG-Fe(II) oxygenase [Flavobacteriaceae bacterium]|tara:strand:+ start:1194 stop:1787 length:594 start_codon:yes stop_codon:yes gene_type:complete
MILKENNITNFIGVYDNYILPEVCKSTVQLYEDQNKLQNTFNRIRTENSSILQKQDEQFFMTCNNFDIWWEDLNPIILNFDLALKHYLEVTGGKEAFVEELKYTSLKIQKTLPTQGYHRWHIEHQKGYDNEARALVFSIYLNDVEDGGETEFLHFSQRIKPKTGRIVIWPSGFPYVHRGNPPLSGVKYLLTSWLMLR